MPIPSASTRKISVCLLANHPLVLAEFQRLLSTVPVRVQPKRVEPQLSDADSIPSAGVYIVDFEGNRMATESLVAKVIERYPNARLLLVGGDFSEDVAFPLLRLGVKGLLQHSQLADQLQRALQSIAAGGYWVPRTLLSRFVDSVLAKTTHGAAMASKARLSRREKEVIQALLDNISNKEIGSRLNISERTVKFHVSNLLRKFGVGRRADLIVMAYQEASRTSPSVAAATLDESGRVH
ncbi:MAG: response regulator transcription factor [Terriglobales bacterium]|jgi:DNA-binding NarL/FixJ family response regulator